MDENRRVSLRNHARRMSTATRVSIVPNQGQTTQSTLRMSMTTTTQRRYAYETISLLIEEQRYLIRPLLDWNVT